MELKGFTNSQLDLMAVLYMNGQGTIAFYEQLTETMRSLGHYSNSSASKDVWILGGMYLEELPLIDPSRHLDCRLTRLTGHGAYTAFEFIKTLDKKKIKKLENAAKSLPKYPISA